MSIWFHIERFYVKIILIFKFTTHKLLLISYFCENFILITFTVIYCSMKKALQSIFILLLTAGVFSTLAAQSVITIEEANAIPSCTGDVSSNCYNEDIPCTTVTVEGVVANGDELGPVRYIIDATAGVAVYNPDFTGDVNVGDEIRVTGQVGEFRCLREIVQRFEGSEFELEVLSTGNTITPIELNASDAFGETYEGSLVTVVGVEFAASDVGNLFSGNTNYDIIDADGNAYTVRIDDDATEIAETLIIPSGPVSLTGLMGQFQDDHQLLPRYGSDIQILGDAPVFSSLLIQTELSPNSISLSYTTVSDGDTQVSYGLTPDLELGTISLPELTTEHSVTIEGLEPGQVYFVQAVSTSASGETANSATIAFATISESSGDIKVYFNRPGDTQVSTGVDAQHLNYAIADTAVAYIERATESIDFCAYSFSATTGICDALNAAAEAGINVRVVVDGEQAAPGYECLNTDLIELTLRFNSSGDFGIMHNKFMVVDADATDPNLPIVWTGSTNYTPNQLNVDPNNVIIIQDQSLARGFTIEFEEMLAGTFGDDKIENTPTEYLIGGVRVENYFSPTAPMNNIIQERINDSDEELYVGVLTMTRFDLAFEISDQAQEGDVVVTMLEQCDQDGAVCDILSDALGENFIKDDEPTIYHHKTMISDPHYTDSDPFVLTGSHNWSTSAQVRNDENTVIVHDATIANIYFQEYFARLCERGGTLPGFDCNPSFFPLGIEELGNETFVNIAPNPTNGQFTVQVANAPNNINNNLLITDITGKIVYQAIVNNAASITVNTRNWTAGIYLLNVAGTTQKIVVNK